MSSKIHYFYQKSSQNLFYVERNDIQNKFTSRYIILQKLFYIQITTSDISYYYQKTKIFQGFMQPAQSIFASLNMLLPFLNINLLNKFHLTFSSNLIIVLNSIKQGGRTLKKMETISLLQQQLTQIKQYVQIQFIDSCFLLKEKITSTTVNRLITQLLFPKVSNRTILQQIRKRILTRLKNKQKIPENQFELIYLLYKQIYNGPMSREDIQKQGCLKTMLISVKKMMGQLNNTKKKNRQYNDPYYINLDLKYLLELCEKNLAQLGNKQLSQKIKLIKDGENRTKWIGPRLWQIIKKYRWINNEINILIQNLRINLKSIKIIRSNKKSLQKIVNRIIQNLKGLIRINIMNDNQFQTQMQINQYIQKFANDQQQLIINNKNIQEQEFEIKQIQQQYQWKQNNNYTNNNNNNNLISYDETEPKSQNYQQLFQIWL